MNARRWRGWLGRALVWACAAGWLLAQPAVAAPAGATAESGPFFPVEQVRPGLRGFGLTVLEGTRIDRFDVEVLGLVRAAGPAGDLVLVRVSGPALAGIGGIAAGMSGSPVYVDGKLLGALGFGFEFTDHSVGLVTPIQDMVRVLRLLDQRPAAAGGQASAERARQSAPAALAGGAERELSRSAGQGAVSGARGELGGLRGSPARTPYRWLALARDAGEAAELKQRAPAGTAVMVPLATPIMAGGLGPRALALARRWLGGLEGPWVPAGTAGGVAAAEGGAGQETGAPAGGAALQPGSALAIGLVRGDIDLSALGTVTYVEGDRFVALGHPFLQRGSVDFFAAPAYIFRTVGRLTVPFKVGVPLQTVGVLAEDRRAGVAGRIGVQPKPVSVRVEVHDLTSDRRRTVQAEVVRDEVLTVPLIALAALEGLDRGLDRIGQGTARVIYRIRGQQLPGGGTYSRDNLYYSRLDISARLLGDFLDTLTTLVYNRFRDIELSQVELSVQVEAARRTASIVRARALEGRVVPGGTVSIEVELQPYRGTPQTRVVTLQVPANVAPGPVVVTVRGGSAQFFTPGPDLESLLSGEPPKASGEQEQQEKPGAVEEAEEPPSSLDKLLELLDRREKNNELVAEFFPGVAEHSRSQEGGPGSAEPPGRPGSRASSGSSTKSESREPPARPGGSVKARLTTPWVIEGSADVELTIEEPPSRPPAGQPSGS